jgi:hypothetical protein
MVSSRFIYTSLRNIIFHINGKREINLVFFYGLSGRKDDSFKNKKRGL